MSHLPKRREGCHIVTSVPRLNPSNIKQGLNIDIMYVYMDCIGYSCVNYCGHIH